VYLHGYGVFRNYYAEALGDLNIEINVFRVGRYKSFVEPFVRDSMSSQARVANLAWLNSLWTHYQNLVSTARNLPTGAIKGYVTDYAESLAVLGGDAASLALQAGLVDELAAWSEAQESIYRKIKG